jgi:hypothetical protein
MSIISMRTTHWHCAIVIKFSLPKNTQKVVIRRPYWDNALLISVFARKPPRPNRLIIVTASSKQV